MAIPVTGIIFLTQLKFPMTGISLCLGIIKLPSHTKISSKFLSNEQIQEQNNMDKCKTILLIQLKYQMTIHAVSGEIIVSDLRMTRSAKSYATLHLLPLARVDVTTHL